MNVTRIDACRWRDQPHPDRSAAGGICRHAAGASERARACQASVLQASASAVGGGALPTPSFSPGNCKQAYLLDRQPLCYHVRLGTYLLPFPAASKQPAEGLAVG